VTKKFKDQERKLGGTNTNKCSETVKKRSTTEVGNLGPDPEEREKYETRFLFCSTSLSSSIRKEEGCNKIMKDFGLREG
jgi:hypothetical protein